MKNHTTEKFYKKLRKGVDTQPLSWYNIIIKNERKEKTMKKNNFDKFVDENIKTFIEWERYMDQYPVFMNDEDPLKYSAPSCGGLYLIGNTLFNPITEEHFYLVKVGISNNLKTRMRGYRTTNPLLFHIDYYTFTGENDLLENACHKILLECCESRIVKTDEWFRVTREKYLEICEKGFQYFLENN